MFRVIVEDGVTVGGDVVQGPAVEKGEESSFTIPDAVVVTDEAILKEVLNAQ